MAGVTNVFKELMLGIVFQGLSRPTKYYYAFITSAVVPNADTVKLSDLDELAVGNGYQSGGFELTPNSVDFPNLVVSNTNDNATVGVRSISILANGGRIPPSSNNRDAAYMVITSTGNNVGNRKVYIFIALDQERHADEGEELRLAGGTLIAE